MATSSTCSPTSRWLSKAKAVQRGLSPGRHREEVTRVKFLVEGAGVCGLAGGEGGRCYAAHSDKRKYCKRLSMDGATVHLPPPGLHFSGVEPYATDMQLDCLRGKPAFDTLIVGPYPDGPLNETVKCLSLNKVFREFANPENAVLRFQDKRSRDSTVPSIAMMKAAARKAQALRVPSQYKAAVANLVKCAAMLEERESALHALRRRAERDKKFQSVARRVLKNIFFLGMYSRRWAGPGTPYPVSVRETNRLVLHHKPISKELQNMHADVTSKGDVVVTRQDDGIGPADFVQDGKLMNMVDAYQYSLAVAVEATTTEHRDFLISHMRMALTKDTVDGTYWPSDETLWEALFLGDKCLAKANVCMRQLSLNLIMSCNMLSKVLYKTTPQWMVYEGALADIQ